MEITGLGSLKAHFYFSPVPFGREWGVKGGWGGGWGVQFLLFSIKHTPSEDVLVETVLKKLYLG